VSLGTPSKLNIKLKLFIPPSGGEALTPYKRGFHKIKMQCECQQRFHMLDTKANVRILPDATKTSTLPLSEGGILSTITWK
jgi:hypothetical protein